MFEKKKTEKRLEEMIEYLEKMANECSGKEIKIDEYFLKHTANALRETLEEIKEA